MSREDFLKFREAVIGNDALKEELANKVKSEEDLLAMAGRLGYRFTVEDVSSSIQLSDNELQSVSGGAGGLLNQKQWTNVSPFNSRVLDLYRR